VQLVTKTGSPVTIPAEGDGHWIPLGALTINTPVDYLLQYRQNTPLTPAGDNVRVYLVANFPNTASWTPVGSAIGSVETQYLGGIKDIVTKASTNAVLTGTITAPSGNISYDTPYEMIFKASSTGAADVIDPVITVNVPDGQVLSDVAGDLKYQDGGGAWHDIPPVAIQTAGGTVTVNSSLFNAGNSYILYGTQANGKTPQQSILNVSLKFKPGCSTSLTGFQFGASFTGNNLLNTPASGTSNLLSGIINTDIYSNYYFTAAVSLTGENAFGGSSIDNTLQIDVNKYSGNADEIFSTDSLFIVLPKWLNVKGNITTTSTGLSALDGEEVSVYRNEVDNNERHIRIQLPYSTLNTASEKGVGKAFSYHIPLVYTQDSQDTDLCDNPEQVISGEIFAQKQFSVACPASPFLLGGSQMDIALLTVSTPNPYAFGAACINELFAMEVTSENFSGGWYSDAGLNNLIIDKAAYSYTPQAVESVNFYIKADIDSNSYGKIRVTVKTPPTTLYWKTTATDNNWNNPNNWATDSEDESNLMNFLPALCTEVLLPSPGSFYPLLSDSAGCEIIDFAHGAVLGRQDLLHYDSARVALTLLSNQWYMFSSPLRNLYPGDFYVNTPNPKKDGYFIEPMFFNMANPQTGRQNPIGTWTGRFNNPAIELELGRGMAVWVDEIAEPLYSNHNPVPFLFPKSDPFYWFYDKWRTVLTIISRLKTATSYSPKMIRYR
jgi:hypothetical protein